MFPNPSMRPEITNIMEGIINLHVKEYIISLAQRHGYASLEDSADVENVNPISMNIQYQKSGEAHDLLRTSNIIKDDNELVDILRERAMGCFESALDFKEAAGLAKKLGNQYALDTYNKIIELEEKPILLPSV